MCQKEKPKQPSKIFPSKEKVRKPKNTPAYYQCLFNASLNGFQGQKITNVCRNCKTNSHDLTSQRNQEIGNLMTAYEQLGNSLRTLLTPLNHVNHTPV